MLLELKTDGLKHFCACGAKFGAHPFFREKPHQSGATRTFAQVSPFLRKVVFAAMELEIFDIAAKPRGPVSAKGIAVEKNYDEDQTVRLLNALVSLNLMERFKHEDGTGVKNHHGCAQCVLGWLFAHLSSKTCKLVLRCEFVFQTCIKTRARDDCWRTANPTTWWKWQSAWKRDSPMR